MMKKFILAGFAALALTAALALAPPARAADVAIDGNLRVNCGEVTAASGAATLNNKCGVITTEALTTTSGSVYTLLLTNSVATGSDIVLWSVEFAGQDPKGDPMPMHGGVGTGTAQFRVLNSTARVVQAFAGQLRIKYLILK